MSKNLGTVGTLARLTAKARCFDGCPDLLEHLRAVGLTITAGRRYLTVTPATCLTEDLRSTIRENKAALLAALAPAPVSRPAQLTGASAVKLIPIQIMVSDGPARAGPARSTHARLIAMGLDDPEAATLAE